MPYSSFPREEQQKTDLSMRNRALGETERILLREAIEYLGKFMVSPETWLRTHKLIWVYEDIEYCVVAEIHQKMTSCSRKKSSSSQKIKPTLSDEF